MNTYTHLGLGDAQEEMMRLQCIREAEYIETKEGPGFRWSV